MPICTYMNDLFATQKTSDDEINRLITEVRELTGEDWRVSEATHYARRWLRKPKRIHLYTIYHCVVGHEFQIMNFYRPDNPTSINTTNEASHVAAFLYGILAGAKSMQPSTK